MRQAHGRQQADRDQTDERTKASSENLNRIIHKHTQLVATAVVIGGLVGNAQDRTSQFYTQVFCRPTLHHIFELVKNFALATFRSRGRRNIIAPHIRDIVGKTWNTQRSKLKPITQLPAALVLGVEIRPEGIGQRDRVTPIPNAATALIAAIGITEVTVTRAALMGDGERVWTGCERGGQAPDLVVVTLGTALACIGVVQFGAVAIEVEGQGLAGVQRQRVIGLTYCFVNTSSTSDAYSATLNRSVNW